MMRTEVQELCGQDWNSDGGDYEYDGPPMYNPPVPDDSDGIPRTPSKGPGPGRNLERRLQPILA